MDFKLKSSFKPKGSQPDAIKSIVKNIKDRYQTLIGVTGSGKSLEYGEVLILKDKKGDIRKIKIGEFVEKNLINPEILAGTEYSAVKGYKILSFNKDYQVQEKKIQQVSRHKEKKVFEITLDDNTQITVTGDHNCFRLFDCRLELCRTDELKVGDFMPLSKTIPKRQKPIKYLNLFQFNPKVKVNVKWLLEANISKKNLIENFFRKHYRAPKWKLRQVLGDTSERGIRIKETIELLDLLGISLVEGNKYLKIITKGKDVTSPLIKINDSFLTLFGLYLAEGHATSKYILISNSNKELQEKCQKFYSGLGLNFNRRNNNDVQYSSVLLANFFAMFGKNAYTKRIPDFVYNLDGAQLKIVLQALFDGDGWVEANSVHIGSVSKELILDIQRLLLRYNITSRIRIRPNFYILNISGKDNIDSFNKSISFSLLPKREKLKNLARNSSNTNVDLIPHCGKLIKTLRKRYNIYQKDIAKIIGCERSYVSILESGKRNISADLFQKLIKWASIKDKSFRPMLNLKDYNFRRIAKIRTKKPSNGYVYDISVKDNENFVANGIFVHNTFTMANVIEKHNKPTLVLAHNKTLAAQLYNEFKEFFPENRVDYFVSYYDYYQPESYIATRDQYIEKDAQINPKIEQMRLAATASLLSRKDVIIVASVSCIYGLGNPENFQNLGFEIMEGMQTGRKELLMKLIKIQYERNDTELMPGRFRVKGDTIDFIPGYFNDIIRIEMFGDKIERIIEIDKQTGKAREKHKYFYVYPARHFVITDEEKNDAIVSIKEEMEKEIPNLGQLEAHRLKKRTMYDIEMIEETGYCKGIENYSRHFDKRKAGEKPYTLMDYFPDDYLLIIDESHQTIPQLHGMYNGDYTRKKALVDYGFRLKSAFDNRPLKFKEFEKYMTKTIFVSATPGDYEKKLSKNIVEQIIRPTGLVDPVVEVRRIDGQIDDVKKEIEATIKKGDRILLTTLTKKLAEELSEHLAAAGFRTRYLHSEIGTIERTEIIRQLRLGKFDCLVGINLLREGLDIPEVGFIGILDADKEGFLRDAKSLIQIIGRAARNKNSKVVLYADNMTGSMKEAISETKRRRELQLEFNKKHNITPMTIKKPIKEKEIELKDIKSIPKSDIPNVIIELEAEMRESAENLQFERAIELRERIKKLEKSV